MGVAFFVGGGDKQSVFKIYKEKESPFHSQILGRVGFRLFKFTSYFNSNLSKYFAIQELHQLFIVRC